MRLSFITQFKIELLLLFTDYRKVLGYLFFFIYICTHIYYSFTNEIWNFPLFRRFSSFNIWILNFFNSSIISLGSSVCVSLLQILIICVSSTKISPPAERVFGKYYSPFIWSTHTCLLKNKVFSNHSFQHQILIMTMLHHSHAKKDPPNI